MRTVRTLLLVAAAALPGGCEWMRSKNGTAVQPRPGGGPLQDRPASQFVAHLNGQAELLRSVSYSDVKLESSEAGRSNPTLRDCYLFASQPRNFRLQAGTLVTSQELDLGSNDKEFWMYVKRLPGENYFFCSHEDFAKPGITFPVPFDPDWVMMAFGMTPYPADGQYSVEPDNRTQTYKLRQQTATRQGQPITKTTVFNNDYDRGNTPIVKAHRIEDAKGQTLCTAEIKSVKTEMLPPDRQRYVQVPTHVVLEWPQQKFVMEFHLSGVKVNDDLTDRSAVLFNRPRINGSNPIDLARYQFVVPNARGQAPGEMKSLRRR